MNYGVFLMLMIGIIGISSLIIPAFIIPSRVFKDTQSMIKYIFIMVTIMILCLFSSISLRSKLLDDLHENNITCKKVISDMNIMKFDNEYIDDNNDNSELFHIKGSKLIYAKENNNIITINNHYKWIKYILVDNEDEMHIESCVFSSNSIPFFTFDCYKIYLTKNVMDDFEVRPTNIN